MTKVQLTQEFIKSIFDYKDGFLYYKINRPPSHMMPGDLAGFTNNKGNRRVIKIDCKKYLHSRIVFLWHHGYLPPIIDHINRIKLDDRIENLRPATNGENTRNRSKAPNKSSQYKGVTFNKRHKKWRSHLMVDGNAMYLGFFDKEIDAAKAYNEAALKYHCEFASINIIKE